MPKLPRNIPVLSWAGRYWLFIVLLIAFALIASNQAAFGMFSMVVWLPVLVIGAILALLLIRNVLYKDTLDEDVRTGKFTTWWDDHLSEKEKVRWILGVTIGLFIGICQIAAALLSFSR